MPRRGKRGERRAHPGEAGDDGRRDRAQVFERTKMCRFHILGACARGAACHFAHDRQELNQPPDLFRTKLCKTLIHTGQCADVQCRYAHTKEELRLVKGFNWSDQSSMDTDQEIPEEEYLPPQFTGLRSQNGMNLHAEAQPFQPQLASDGSTEQLWDSVGSVREFQGANHDSMATPAAFQIAAMHQMAAKAHAAEAARLQAMASYLEAHGAVAARAAMGNVLPGRVGIPLPAFGAAGTGAGANPLSGSGSWEGPGFGATAATTPTGATMPSAMAVPRASAGSASGTPLPPAEDSAVATGHSGATATAGGAGTVGVSALTRSSPFNKSEPAQINPKTLRSYSSECLVQLEAMAKLEGIQQADTGVPTASPPSGHLSSSVQAGSPEGNSAASLAWTVKNTFLDFEPQQQPPQGRLRSICSAAGRLDALGGDAVSQPESPELLPHPADQQGFGVTPGRSYVSRGSALGLVTEDSLPPASAVGLVTEDSLPPVYQESAADCVGVGEIPATGTMGSAVEALNNPESAVLANAAAGGAKTSDAPSQQVQPPYSGGDTEQAQPLVVVQSSEEMLDIHPSLDDGLGEGSFTVKNTFLDFGPAAPSTLRSVRTAAGRLDCMAEESPLNYG